MSHFTAIVITNNTHTKGKRKANELASFDPEIEIEDLLAPFDENWETPPRPEDCYCKNEEGVKTYKSGSTVDWGREGEPAPDCEDCEGSGTSVTTYNPKSKWDWYVVGGRWEGELVEGYDANDDIRNYEKCTYCEGTGLRDDEIGKNQRAKNPALGMKRNFENAPTGTNVAFVKDIAKDFEPFAFVTPHYEWVERAEMGWFGQSRNDNELYEQSWEETRKQYSDHVAVLVDCHI